MFLDSIYVLFFSESIGIKESIPQDFILGVGVFNPSCQDSRL